MGDENRGSAAGLAGTTYILGTNQCTQCPGKRFVTFTISRVKTINVCLQQHLAARQTNESLHTWLGVIRTPLPNEKKHGVNVSGLSKFMHGKPTLSKLDTGHQHLNLNKCHLGRGKTSKPNCLQHLLIPALHFFYHKATDEIHIQFVGDCWSTFQTWKMFVEGVTWMISYQETPLLGVRWLVKTHQGRPQLTSISRSLNWPGYPVSVPV